MKDRVGAAGVIERPLLTEPKNTGDNHELAGTVVVQDLSEVRIKPDSIVNRLGRCDGW